MGNQEGIRAVPAFYAADHYLGHAGVVVLMLALFAVILTSLIGNLLALSRLLFAASREGDEFAVISQGSDLERIDELADQIRRRNEEASRDGGIVIACGTARYEEGRDDSVASVFERADKCVEKST